MKPILVFYAGAVLGAILGFFIAAMCTVSSRCSREEETRDAMERMRA